MAAATMAVGELKYRSVVSCFIALDLVTSEFPRLQFSLAFAVSLRFGILDLITDDIISSSSEGHEIQHVQTLKATYTL